MKQISPAGLKEWLDDEGRKNPVLLDVRETAEHQICKIEGSLLMPMHLIPLKIAELSKADEIVTICHHGMRSGQAAQFLLQNGFSKILNLQGGVEYWAISVDNDMQRY
jgi:rhodanese-related sulfurtransferase